MANEKITQLSAIASVAADDILPIVDDVAGTPITKKTTVTQLATAIHALPVSGGFEIASPGVDYEYMRLLPVAPDTYSEDFHIAGTSTLNADATYNFVVSIGHNLRAGTAIDGTKHAIGITMEQYWDNGSTHWAEWHEEFIPSVTANGVTDGVGLRLSSTIVDVDTNAIYRFLTLGQFWIQKEASASMGDSSKGTYFKAIPGELTLTSGTEGTSENWVKVTLSGTGTDRVATVSVQDQLVLNTVQIVTLDLEGCTINGSPNFKGAVNVSPTASAAELNVKGGTGSAAYIRLYNSAETDGELTLYAFGGGLGDAYASIGHADNNSVSRGSILFDTRAGISPIRIFVGAIGGSSVSALDISDTADVKIRGSFAAKNKTPSTPALTGSTTLAQLMQALEDIGLIDYTP